MDLLTVKKKQKKQFYEFHMIQVGELHVTKLPKTQQTFYYAYNLQKSTKGRFPNKSVNAKFELFELYAEKKYNSELLKHL